VEFTFAAGDLFDADVDAIVNSEQSDFIARLRNAEITLSAVTQIRRMTGYGTAAPHHSR